MGQLNYNSYQRYAISLIFFLVALTLRFFLVTPDSEGAFISFFPSVLFASYLCGVGPGILNSFISVLAIDYFFIEPYNSFSMSSNDLIFVLLFLISSVYLCWLTAKYQAAKAKIDILGFERQGTIDELNLSKARWSFVTENVSDGIWEWDIPSGNMVFSKRWYEIHGVEEKTVGPKIDLWKKRVHPDDLPIIEKELQAHFGGTAAGFRCEYRFMHQNGEYAWTLGCGKVVSRNADGAALRVVGTHTSLSPEQILRRGVAHHPVVSPNALGKMLSPSVEPGSGEAGLSRLAFGSGNYTEEKSIAREMALRFPQYVLGVKRRLPLVLVCAPWGSGSSAIAGVLANTGLIAPGPYFVTDDLLTPISYEMLPFINTLKKLVSDQTLQRVASSDVITNKLTRFRDGILTNSLNDEQLTSNVPILLKHALSALVLPEICEVFDTRIVAVVRPLADVDRTISRRKWQKEYGSPSSQIIYRNLFHYINNSSTPSLIVSYPDLLEKPGATLEALAKFCGMQCNMKALDTVRFPT